MLTPPPETDVTVGPAAPALANTASTSPAVLGDTARVVSPDPVAEVELPTDAMVPGGVAYVNWSGGPVADVPADVVTFTSTVDAPAAGEVAVMEVDELTLKVEAATEPKRTALAPVKLVPEMVTEVPPAVDPVLALRPVTVGTLAPVGCWQLIVPLSWVPLLTVLKAKLALVAFSVICSTPKSLKSLATTLELGMSSDPWLSPPVPTTISVGPAESAFPFWSMGTKRS